VSKDTKKRVRRSVRPWLIQQNAETTICSALRYRSRLHKSRLRHLTAPVLKKKKGKRNRKEKWNWFCACGFKRPPPSLTMHQERKKILSTCFLFIILIDYNLKKNSRVFFSLLVQPKLDIPLAAPSLPQTPSLPRLPQLWQGAYKSNWGREGGSIGVFI